MQHSSLNPLLSNEDGVCGGYLGGYLFVGWGGWGQFCAAMTHFSPLEGRAVFRHTLIGHKSHGDK